MSRICKMFMVALVCVMYAFGAQDLAKNLTQNPIQNLAQNAAQPTQNTAQATKQAPKSTKEKAMKSVKSAESAQNLKVIYLAGGCFWGLEAYLKEIDGVQSAEVGYANGKTPETNYHILPITDHAESVKVVYDSAKLPLARLLEYYFKVIDPTSINKQGNDRGRQYRTGIYYLPESSASDEPAARAALNALQSKHKEKIQVELGPLKNYVKAEEYHQDYLAKNPGGYCHFDIEKALEGVERKRLFR